MSRYLRIRLLVVAAVAVIAGSVWFAGDRQRATAERAFAETQAAERMLVAMLDQETGFYGHVGTGMPVLLERYEDAQLRFERALLEAEAGAPESERDERAAIAEQRRLGEAWRELADSTLRTITPGSGDRVAREVDVRLRTLLEGFRDVNADFRADLREEREANQADANTLSVALIVALSVLFGAIGFLSFERRARGDDRRRRLHARFSEVLQLARSEAEAYAVVKRYLEELVAGATATVLNRNSSANRLETRTAVEDPDLRLRLETVEPEACMAIRGGRIYQRGSGRGDLMECGVCGAVGRDVTCVPSLVGGEVIGSVLIEHSARLPAAEAEQLSASIAEAAPVISNLRNLAIAELRAATDGLTGLPNHRAIEETLRRLAAQSIRTGSPLAAVMFDLDHFKQVNDTFGHGKGDEVLAMVGQITSASLRTSDFAGRYGGEEFVALLPDTGREQALHVAEKMRRTIGGVRVGGVDRDVTASFGVAIFPDDAADIGELLRMADRALYTAKARGRNRVELFTPPRPAAAPTLAATPE